eukprot:g21424.t1
MPDTARIAVAELAQETDSFSPLRTRIDAFETYGLFYGNDVIERMEGAGPLGGFLEVAADEDAASMELVPLLRAWASAGGPIADETFDALLSDLVARLRNAGPVDAVFLALHGAASSETENDVEGATLQAVREVVGDEVPIVVPFDHHANITRRMVQYADVLIGHETQPHDPPATGRKAARLLFRMLKNEISPKIAWRKIPMITPQDQFLTRSGPMKDWFDQARRFEQQPNVLDVSPCPMQPWLDVAEGGWSVVVQTDNNPDLAESIADEMAQFAWQRRREFWKSERVAPKEAVQQAARADGGLVILSDTGDSVYGGAPGDNTILLNELISQNPPCLALVPVVDAEAVADAFAAGVAATVSLTVGGKGDTEFCQPVELTGRVAAVSEGVTAEIPGRGISQFGRTAMLECGSVRIALLDHRSFGINHPLLYEHLGVAVADAKMVVLKTASNFQFFDRWRKHLIRLKGKLLLDTRAGMLKGGENGPLVVPGDLAKSGIIAALKHETFKMPPKGKLPARVIADFEKWIKIGAPDPRDGKSLPARKKIDIDAARSFWSFQPLRDSKPPKVKDARWAQTDIDRFVRSRQESAGVTPNGMAEPRSLIRRAYFDLIGLPPAPAEVEEFVAECKSDPRAAYTRLIDRLLSSRHYGERWSRHWLDLARFAESNGYAFDKDRPNAYRYRDFVIRALNADMPYDEFIRLQIAGDLLAEKIPAGNPAKKLEAISATGFLVAGTFTTQQTQKERERSRYEQLDDMLATTGTAMLGLTLGCARCHDHKYDPLPQHDYYRMAAAFADVGFSDTGVDLHPEIYRKAKAKWDTEHAPLAKALAEFEKKQLPARFAAWLKDRPATNPAPKLEVWNHIGPFTAASFDAAFQQTFGPETKVDLKKTYNNGRLRWRRQPKWVDGKVHNTLTGTNAANYLFRVVNSPVAQKIGLSLGSDDAIRVWVNGVEILSKKVGRAAAADQEKVQLPLKKGRNELLMKIVNGGGPSGFYFKASLNGLSPQVAAILKIPESKWNAKQRQQVLTWYRTLDEDWVKLNGAVAAHNKKLPKPNLTMAYAAKVRGTTYNFGADTYKVYFLSRGNADLKQGQAAPGFLRVLMRADEKQWFTSLAPEKKKPVASKPPRIALADWLTDTNRGAGHLLARVIVNRLWQHHFGRGIVATPSDFGIRGERPSHPELLDWLAAELIRGGWRLKPIHKLMMTSAVYTQSGKMVAASHRADPENLLLWRSRPRRLEGEVIRDSLLDVSGSLDKTMFGKGSLDEKTPRRSIYLTVKRSQRIPFLQLFDAPETMQGIGRREESTVAPQALSLLNSAFVRNLAEKFARRARPDAKAPLADSIDRAYQLAYSRVPTADEKESMLKFIAAQTASRGKAGNAAALAFRDFCHILLCANEFIYVD